MLKDIPSLKLIFYDKGKLLAYCSGSILSIHNFNGHLSGIPIIGSALALSK
jgi:hypothetical protein